MMRRIIKLCTPNFYFTTIIKSYSIDCDYVRYRGFGDIRNLKKDVNIDELKNIQNQILKAIKQGKQPLKHNDNLGWLYYIALYVLMFIFFYFIR